MKNQICTILGGGGFIGRYLVRNLTKKNFRCIIPTRNAFTKGYLKTQAAPGAIEFINFNTDEIKNAIENSDIVINLCGILYETRKQKFNTIHVDLPETIATLCAQSDVKKFVHVSAIGASKESQSKYQQSKFLGEERALNNFENTLIVRPSIVEGPESLLSNLFANLSSFFPILPVLKMNTYRIQPLMVNDCAKAIVSAIETKDNSKAIYELGGNKVYTFGEYVELILKIIRKKRMVVDMPMSLAKLQSSILSVLPFKPILSRDQCIILESKDNVVSGAHLTFKDLNIKPVLDLEKEMEKYLWRWRPSGEFNKDL